MWFRKKKQSPQSVSAPVQEFQRGISETLVQSIGHLSHHILEQNAKAQNIIIDEHQNFLKKLDPKTESERQARARIVTALLPYVTGDIRTVLDAADKTYHFVMKGQVPPDPEKVKPISEIRKK